MANRYSQVIQYPSTSRILATFSPGITALSSEGVDHHLCVWHPYRHGNHSTRCSGILMRPFSCLQLGYSARTLLTRTCMRDLDLATFSHAYLYVASVSTLPLPMYSMYIDPRSTITGTVWYPSTTHLLYRRVSYSTVFGVSWLLVACMVCMCHRIGIHPTSCICTI